MCSSILGYVYLLQTRESCEKDEDIFKIGRTNKKQFERFNQYPNGSVLYLQIKCVDCVSLEKHLLKLFSDSFDRCERCKIYGSEYFKGDPSLMMQIILHHLNFSCNLEQNQIIQQKFTLLENSNKSLLDEISVLKNKCTKISNELQLANTNHFKNQQQFLQQTADLNKQVFELQSEVNLSNNEDVVMTEVNDDDGEKTCDKNVCERCLKVFSSKYTKQRHQKLCNGAHSLQCHVCKKSFNTRQSKYHHMKNAKCEPCIT